MSLLERLLPERDLLGGKVLHCLVEEVRVDVELDLEIVQQDSLGVGESVAVDLFDQLRHPLLDVDDVGSVMLHTVEVVVHGLTFRRGGFIIGRVERARRNNLLQK